MFTQLIANSLGFRGNRLVLETDGTEICDDETLEYFANEKQIFIILDENEEWSIAGAEGGN